MPKVCLTHLRSKMAQSALSCLKEHEVVGLKELDQGERADYLFLFCASQEAAQIVARYQGQIDKKILDFSGAYKLAALKGEANLTYGFAPLYNAQAKIVAMPGCSSLGILSALFPLRKLLTGPVFADVKFSKSAVRYKSSSQEEELIVLKHPFKHFHQLEVNAALNQELVLLAPSVINLSAGVSINLFFTNPASLDWPKILGQNLLPHTRLTERPQSLQTVIGTSQILMYAQEAAATGLINIQLDNLVYNRFADFL